MRSKPLIGLFSSSAAGCVVFFTGRRACQTTHCFAWALLRPSTCVESCRRCIHVHHIAIFAASCVAHRIKHQSGVVIRANIIWAWIYVVESHAH